MNERTPTGGKICLDHGGPTLSSFFYCATSTSNRWHPRVLPGAFVRWPILIFWYTLRFPHRYSNGFDVAGVHFGKTTPPELIYEPDEVCDALEDFVAENGGRIAGVRIRYVFVI